MKTVNFENYIEKFIRNFENRLKNGASDQTLVNTIEMSYYDLKAAEILKAFLVMVFLSFPFLLIYNPVKLQLSLLILIFWTIMLLLMVYKYRKYVPRFDYLKQLKESINVIVSLQKVKHLQLDVIMTKDLLESTHFSIIEKKFKLYDTQLSAKRERDDSFEPKKMSKLLANFLISPEVMGIKTNDESINYPLCIQFNIKSSNIKNYASVLNLSNRIKNNDEFKLTPEKSGELYDYLNQVENIYKNGIHIVDFIRKRLDEEK